MVGLCELDEEAIFELVAALEDALFFDEDEVLWVDEDVFF